MLIAGYIPGYVNKPPPTYRAAVVLGGRYVRDTDEPACVAIDCYEPLAKSSDKWCEKHLR